MSGWYAFTAAGLVGPYRTRAEARSATLWCKGVVIRYIDKETP